MTDSWPQSRRLPVRLTGIFIVSQIIIAAYVLLALWPPTIRAATATSVPDGQATSAFATPEQSVAVAIFGFHFSTTIDGLYIILVMAAGALGSALSTATSFATYMGNRRFASHWIPWYLIRFPIGLGLPLIVYFGIQGGLLNINAGSSALNPYGIVAVSGFAGMFSKQIMDKLKAWADKQFGGVEDELEGTFAPVLSPGEEGFSVPRIDSIEPSLLQLSSDGQDIKIMGDNFSPLAKVLVNGESRTIRTIATNEIRATLTSSDLSSPRDLQIVIQNPASEGALSARGMVTVGPPSDSHASSPQSQ